MRRQAATSLRLRLTPRSLTDLLADGTLAVVLTDEEPLRAFDLLP